MTRIDGTTPAVLLSSVGRPDSPMNGGVSEAHFTADGANIVFRADSEAPNRHRLYSVPASGGIEPRFLTPMADEADVRREFATAGSDFVVYRADARQDEQNELFSVPINGSTLPVRLNEPLDPEQRVASFRVGPRGERIFFSVPRFDNVMISLQSAPVEGGRVKLHSPGNTAFFEPTADGNRVVYLTDLEGGNRQQLYLDFLTPQFNPTPDKPLGLRTDKTD